jgi:hypothetical protein
MGIAQEPFYAKIDRKKAGDQMEHPDLTPASPTVRTLSVNTLLGEKQSNPRNKKTFHSWKATKEAKIHHWNMMLLLKHKTTTEVQVIETFVILDVPPRFWWHSIVQANCSSC